MYGDTWQKVFEFIWLIDAAQQAHTCKTIASSVRKVRKLHTCPADKNDWKVVLMREIDIINNPFEASEILVCIDGHYVHVGPGTRKIDIRDQRYERRMQFPYDSITNMTVSATIARLMPNRKRLMSLDSYEWLPCYYAHPVVVGALLALIK